MAKLSNRYAAALFEISIERNALQENLSQADFLRETLETKECQSIITHPRISTAEKMAFLDTAFSGQISQDIMGLLHLVVTKNREKAIVPILIDFIEMGNRHIRKTTATVVSAVELSSEQIDSLAALLSRKLNKQVDILSKVDASIIGGLYINVDGFYIDKTIKTRLRDIKESMAAV